MQTTFNLAEHMFILARGTDINTLGFVVRKKIAVFFTSLENYRSFHRTLKMGREDSAVRLRGWELSLIVAEQLKAAGATHVGIDPVDDNFLSLPIQVFIDDLESMMLDGKRRCRPSDN